MLITVFATLILAFVLGETFCYFFICKNKNQEGLNKLKKELEKKKYENRLYQELDKRIGTSLDPLMISENLISSLEKMIDYQIASFLISIQENNLKFRCKVKDSVSPSFIKEVKKRMIHMLEEKTNKNFLQATIDETLTGTILDDKNLTAVNSFFALPIKIGDKPGVIAVASGKKDSFSEEEKTSLSLITDKACNMVTHLQEILEREKVAEEKRRLEAERLAYQAEVLRELYERIGYSIDVAKIIEVITGSLARLLNYNTVSYMIFNGDKIIFKSILHKSVNRAFVEDVKQKMLKSFSQMINRELMSEDVDESITGTIFDETTRELANSYFNLPLVINKQIVGIITAASPKMGLYSYEETSIFYTITAQTSIATTKLAQVLESEKEKLNALVASLTDGIVMMDKSWNLLVVNPQARHMLNIPDGEITTLDILDKLSGKIDLRTKIEEAVKNKTVITIPDITIEGQSLQISTLPVKDKDGELFGSIVVFHDITKSKELEALRDQFEAMMIHELRSPLNNVRAITDNLLRDIERINTEELAKSLNLTRGEISDMLALVNDLLDVAKIEAGKFSITKKETDLSQLITGVVERHLPRAKEKGLDILTEFHGDIKNIPLDSFYIRRALTNITSNAIKFTEKGKITIAAEQKDDNVTISVTDTGIGMPHETLNKLFTKFHQLRVKGAHIEGTGLGLFIARGIVEAHGGKIWAESTLNDGSTFYFTLPIYQET